jgi:hypothetical protein
VIKPGNVTKIPIRLISKTGATIIIDSIESMCPWIQVSPDPINGVYWCSALPPADLHGQGFAGYLQFHLSSPEHRAIRILYYGAIEKDVGQNPDKRASNLSE